ncbi:MAG: hypothetical protein V9G18_05600 [Albidovulum sp.]|jgi:hypothetical protein|uniref:hypothetical protein n=1 Tax=Albidovulum sp. TaxID=1872424 RepID=UPI00305B596A
MRRILLFLQQALLFPHILLKAAGSESKFVAPARHRRRGAEASAASPPRTKMA